jgi:N-acetylglucosaminyldiphosphoundecaprenol N-acetyl-beta-D-mannosaminyltransferase
MAIMLEQDANPAQGAFNSAQDAVSFSDDVAIGSDGKVHFPRVIVGGLPTAVLDRKATARLTVAAALSRRGKRRPCAFFTTTNGQVVSLCASQPDVKRLFERADLISADGMSVVFASRLGPGPHLPERVATTDAFHDVARLAGRARLSFYFLGASEDVNRRAVERVKQSYPGVKIAGRHHGYFAPAEEPEIIEKINAAGPDVLWVGLGVPHQQRFILNNLARLTSVGVAKSCGGLFDFLAGKNKRAPRWMQVGGLEWAYRIWMEPNRLLMRYLTTNPHAAYWLLRSRGLASEGVIDADTPA